MKWAILSDVHGNLEAFRAVARDLRNHGAERIAFAGDVVGYGADPNQCQALLRELTDWVVAGNHDCAAVGLTDIEAFNPQAQAAILWTREKLSRENIAYLRKLPLFDQRGGITLVHASPNEPGEWNYIQTYPQAEEGFRMMTGDLAFVGHSHRPMVLAKEGGRGVEVLDAEEATLEEGVRYIINVGSVGQPRDGDPRAAYGLYDDRSRKYLLKRVSYDVQAAREKIIKAGLPPFLAHRLLKGV